MELRESHDFYAQLLFVLKWVYEIKMLIFLLWKLYDLEASSLLIQTDIVRTLFQELAETQIMPRTGVAFCKSDFVDHYPVLEEYRYQAKNVCQCSPTGKILGFSTFLPLMLARGCSVYLEYCFWLTQELLTNGGTCLQSAALPGGAETASMSLPNPFLFFTQLKLDSHLTHHYNWKSH